MSLVQATAQEVTRDDGVVRVKLTADGTIPVTGPFTIELAEPIDLESGESVAIEIYWPASTGPVVRTGKFQGMFLAARKQRVA